MPRPTGSILLQALLILATGAAFAGPAWHGPAGRGGFVPRPVGHWGFAPRPVVRGELGPRTWHGVAMGPRGDVGPRTWHGATPGPRGDFGPRTWHGAALPPRGGWFGRPVTYLPHGYLSYTWHGSPWYCHAGLWYRPWRGAYISCYPPVGLWLDVLPIGFTSVWFGGTPYYCYENVYYVQSDRGGYTVVDPPAEAAAPAPSPDGAALDALLITPKEGQSQERMRADRREAQARAIARSGYDPAYTDPGDPGTPRARRTYLRILREELEKRGYSVE